MMDSLKVCSACKSTVTSKQEDLICDICVRWFHRKCFNKTEVEMSRLLKKSQWNDSSNCAVPPADIPRLVDYSDSECSEISPIPMKEEIFAFPAGCSAVVESSIEASGPRDLSSENAEATFVVEGGLSQRNHPKLYERHGYSYTVLRTSLNGSVTWRCSVRRKGNVCPAKVYQIEENFSRNDCEHTHDPKPNEWPF
uniref:uncharacterized protein LOC120344136 isoform X3 n=1 Tax=Styela clava TaxID=7725 RepID=UPI0019397C4A|nr:uncharacterized protein LOC120344136 isoform X3 [Styela clava]